MADPQCVDAMRTALAMPVSSVPTVVIRRPWVRGELPWLTSGPLIRVHVDARDLLEQFLSTWGYARVDLDGRVMTSRQTAHAELAQAFAFPSYYGHNWDAFDDCFSDFAEEHSGHLVAVVWAHLDAVPPATAAEVGWALLGRTADEENDLLAVDVFAIGAGDEFDRP